MKPHKQGHPYFGIGQTRPTPSSQTKTKEEEIIDLGHAAQSTLQRLYEMTESREAKDELNSAMVHLNRVYFNTKEK
jgi:hypothetical protein